MSETTPRIRTRFAPSPTGYMHIGNLRTALYGYLFAKGRGGDFILRIEDTDQKRLVSGAVDLIIKTMAETGLHFDEGPGIGGDCGPYIQSQRKHLYKEYAEKLVERGAAYYCFCTQERLKTIEGEAGTHRYDRQCLHLSPDEIKARVAVGEPYCIRQKMPDTGVSSYKDAVYGEISIENKELEDNVLLKSDGLATYNFANVVDDHLMGITVVIRGCEYLSSTPKYNLLYDAFGWPRPMYIHLPTINKDKRRKLSKRNGEAAYGDLIAAGFLKEAVLNYIALLGWSPKNNQEKMSFDDMMRLFSVEGINKSPAIFDPLKLRWLNSLYIKEMSAESFYEYAKPYLAKCKTVGKYDDKKLCALVQGRIETFDDIAEKVNFLEEFCEFDSVIYTNEKQKSDPILAKEVLPKIIAALENLPEAEYNNAALYACLKELAAQNGLKASQILWPCRVAVSARESTAGGATELIELLGKAETIKRLKLSFRILRSSADA